MTTAGRMVRPFLRRHVGSLAGAGLGTILLTAANLASPWPLKFVIDKLFADRPRPFALTSEDLTLLALVTVLILAIAGVKAVAEYYSDVWLKRSGEQIVHELRVVVYEHLQRLSLSFHDGQKKGNLVTRVTGDVNSVGAIFSESLGEILSAVLLLVGMAVVTFILDPLLALATLGVTPFLFIVTNRYRTRLKDLAHRQRAEEGEIASLADEALGAMQVVKAFGSEGFEQGRVELRSQWRLQLGVVLSRTEARFSGLIDVLGAVAAALVTAIGVFRVASGALTPGDLIVFTSYATKTYKPLRDIARQIGKVSRAIARADRVAEILSADALLEDRPGAWRGRRAAGAVELKDVSFAYRRGRPVLEKISLNIEAGSRVAIVGPSGAGKSTIGALVARFYDPATGEVSIDGRDARDCSLEWMRNQVGFLLQDTVLFSGTVAANISYATDASLDDVVAAAKVARADEFIRELPAGYDTELGPRGVGLSGGQRQRLGIARVLMRDPPILILDEPTVGLDAVNEARVIEGLYALMGGRTTIVISHSIPLARTADRVVVLEHGRIIEDGPPERLLAGSGTFARLARTQEGGHARRPRPSAPPDPALPKMNRLLDVDAMAAVLQRSLKEELRDQPIANVSIARVRYDPHQRVMVHYRATIGDEEHHGVATTLAGQDLAAKVHNPRYAHMAEIVDGRSPGARPALHDEEVDAIITWLPFDVKLPGVAVRPAHLVARMAEAGIPVPNSASGPLLVGYKPAARAVMRFGNEVLKAYGKERQFEAALTGLVASGRAASVPAADFVGALPNLRLTVQAAVAGKTPETALEAAAAAGSFVRTLQAQRVEGPLAAPPSHQLREGARHAAVAAAVVPKLRRSLERLLEELSRSMPVAPPMATAHGDFHVDQLIVQDGSFVCIDFDGMCTAPAALDIATYAADVVRGRGDDEARIHAVLEPLLEGYGKRPDSLDWYLCTAILCRATHPFRSQAAHWPERVEAMIEAAGAAVPA